MLYSARPPVEQKWSLAVVFPEGQWISTSGSVLTAPGDLRYSSRHKRTISNGELIDIYPS